MNIAILASGRGSNADAIFARAKLGLIPDADFTVLISDIPNAPALDVARKYSVEAKYVDPQRVGARFNPDGARAYIDELKSRKTDLVVLAGFMRILPPEFVAAFENRIINLHPSLLPSFKGKDAIKQAYGFGVKLCGCTVHFVDNTLDGGKIIAQKAVEIEPQYTLDELEARVHDAEHILLPQVVADIAAGKIAIGK